jgi:hypothetical protein
MPQPFLIFLYSEAAISLQNAATKKMDTIDRQTDDIQGIASYRMWSDMDNHGTTCLS